MTDDKGGPQAVRPPLQEFLRVEEHLEGVLDPPIVSVEEGDEHPGYLCAREIHGGLLSPFAMLVGRPGLIRRATLGGFFRPGIRNGKNEFNVAAILDYLHFHLSNV